MGRPKSAKRNRLNTTVKPVTTAAISRLAKALDMPAGRVIDAALDCFADLHRRGMETTPKPRSLDNPATWDEANTLLASLPTKGNSGV